MTEKLLQDSYWKSFNVAYYEESLNVNEYLQKRTSVCICEAQRGPLFDVAQRHVKVLPDLLSVLRTNTWQSSELSWSCPKCAVAGRMDLQGHNVSIGAELPQSTGNPGCGPAALHGAIDAKVADDLMVTRGETIFVSGPVNVGVPAFSWETAAGGIPSGVSVPNHVGHPSGPWRFAPHRVGVETFSEVGGVAEPVVAEAASWEKAAERYIIAYV
jgi:hypothetical protein